MGRACRALPQEQGGGVVYNRLAGSSWFAPRFARSPQTTLLCWGGGRNKYQGPGADCLQRPLRSRYWQQLKAGVGHHIGGFMAKFSERIQPQGRVPNPVNFTT
jgi:hypothetical protein